ncbi:MAG: 1-acyl-sn-glycerol-3-phosphate acyltransferase [Bacteroidales bacterium]|nr:1-acyl-sn-glycerol-3-phosphate acyltransferase [Bacteroidales bacterium]
MGRKNIYDKDLGYTVLKPIVDWCVKNSYRKVEIKGQENIPTDGAVILAPNHCNTLMDAIVILRAHKDHTVFGARADMFGNKLVAKIMYFLRILPMVRQRDGLRNVLKNVETQEVIVETLESGVRFCMFPEGRHRAVKSLLPLGKGIFRAALAANAKFGDKKPVYIVPVGIEYGDFFRYRGTSLLTYGKPINVTEFVRNSDVENEAQLINRLSKELAVKISELFTFIPDGETVKEKWALTKMLSIASGRKPYGNYGTCLYDSMMNNREIIYGIEKTCERNPEGMQKLLENVKEFEKYRRKDGISIYSFRKNNNFLSSIGKSIASLIGLPYFIVSAILCLPMWIAEYFVRSIIKDKAFRNTGSFGIKLGLGIVWFIILATLVFCLLPWKWALALILLFIPSYSYFHDYIEGMRRFVSDIRFNGCRKLRKRFEDILKDYKSL